MGSSVRGWGWGGHVKGSRERHPGVPWDCSQCNACGLDLGVSFEPPNSSNVKTTRKPNVHSPVATRLQLPRQPPAASVSPQGPEVPVPWGKGGTRWQSPALMTLHRARGRHAVHPRVHVCEREGCVRDVCLRYLMCMWHGIYMYVICVHTCKRTPAGYTAGSGPTAAPPRCVQTSNQDRDWARP